MSNLVYGHSVVECEPDRHADGNVLKPDGWTPPDVLGAVFGTGER